MIDGQMHGYGMEPNKPESDTPRTDAAAVHRIDSLLLEDGRRMMVDRLYVPIEFARDLEREIAALNDQWERRMADCCESAFHRKDD